MLIDTHCHINSLSPEQQKAVISLNCQRYCFIDSSIDLNSSLKSLELSKTAFFIYSSIGFHPFCTKEYTADTLKQYEQLIDGNVKVAAIGEIGLDYKAVESWEKQETVFCRFLELANKKSLPVVIHNRFESADNRRTLDILDGFYRDYKNVIFHCFSYSKELLLRITDKAGFISFSLNILRNKKSLLQALQACPLDNLLLETDSPYMKINDRLSQPADIEQVYSFASQIRKESREKIEESIYSNIKRAFPIISL